MKILTTRQKTVETRRIISSELTKMQKVFYDEEMRNYYKEENEEHLYLEMFDFIDFEIIEYKKYNKVIGLNHSDIDTFTTKLSKKLTELFKTIGVEEIFVVSHLKLDFFGNRENKYKPLVKAYKKLERIVGNNTYKEAFTFKINNLKDFVEILFWTTRCDMSIAEYIFLFDKSEKIQIHLCKYGNIHITEFEKENLTVKRLNSLGWTIIEGEEYDNFSNDGKIKGRRMEI